MPSEKRKRPKAPPRKTAGLRQQEAPASPLSLLANPSDLRGLEIFLTQTRGFRLALALHDDMRVRDQINRYLQEKLQASRVELLLVDLRKESAETSLLGSAAAAFAAHSAKPGLADGRAALALVNLESRVNYNPELCNGQDQKSAYLATANLQRDLWPATFDGPVLIWMSELLEPAMAKWAPDLWHWRSHVFDLRKMQSEKVFDVLSGSKESDLNLKDETQAGVVQRLARLQTQLDAYRKAGNRGDEARVLNAIGLERLTLGHTQLAAQDFEEAVKIAREIGDKRGEGRFLGRLGVAWDELGEARQSIVFFEQALAIAREIGDKDSEGGQLGNLGNAWFVLGESHRAMVFYEQALTISYEVGDKRTAGNHLGHLGNAWLNLGEIQKAINFYEQALIISREFMDKKSESNFLSNLGVAWSVMGEDRRGVNYFEQALVISREIKNKRGEASDLGNLGRASVSLGEIHRAIEFYKAALTVFREVGDKRGESDTLLNLAISLKQIGSNAELQDAALLAKDALEIFEVIESPYTNATKALLAKWQTEK